MDTSIEALVAYITLVVGLSVTFGKVFGGYQTEITQAIIDAVGVRSRYRRLVNMAIGILIASLFTVVGALSIGAPWQIIPAGVLAGIMASVEASRVHDQESTAAYTKPP